jgi:TRAP-type C4-dicarboxylate transport system permease small subunit
MEHMSSDVLKKITAPSFKEWVFILMLLVVIFVLEIIILYSLMIPNILLAFENDLSQIQINLISTNINKIVMGLSVWGILLFIIMIRLISIVWNIEKHFSYKEKNQ